jgi:hypothetical protein
MSETVYSLVDCCNLWPLSPFSLFGYYTFSLSDKHRLVKFVIFAVVEAIVYLSFYYSHYPSYLNAMTWLLSPLLGPTCITVALALVLTRSFTKDGSNQCYFVSREKGFGYNESHFGAIRGKIAVSYSRSLHLPRTFLRDTPCLFAKIRA